MIINLTTVFCDNYFPPIVIEVIKYSDNNYENRTEYRVPSDGFYDSVTIGIWHVS